MSLSEKSDEEISRLLTEYGIAHGPIVDSTRRLYEKKLEKAMESSPLDTSSDKTYYREEEEEITYITYSPPRQEVISDTLKRRGNVEPEEDEESEEDTEPPIPATNRTANHSAVKSSKQQVCQSGGCGVWKGIKLLLLLAVLAAVGYYAYCHAMELQEEPAGVERV